jgi:phospholipase C
MSNRTIAFGVVAAAFALSGCNNDAPLPGPAEWNRPVTAPESDGAALTMRRGCAFRKGAMPAETHGADTPNGRKIPIDHIVVIMMENRSFDHYFQKLPEAGITDVEVAPAGFTNPDMDGKPVGLSRDTQHCFIDTAHGWNAIHRQINGPAGAGKMDGFFRTSDGDHDLPMGGGTPEMLSGARAMTYYEPGDLPFSFWAAQNFAIADHYFCSVPGPTWPNRMYLYGATSAGHTSNEFAKIDNLLFDYLDQRQVKWGYYYQSIPGLGVFLENATKWWGTNVIEWFGFDEALAGELPNVVFLDPLIGREGPGANDEHPPAVMQLGQKFLEEVVGKLMASKYWDRTAIFITYDEHGGLYDHVPPPKACAPDDLAPDTGPNDEPGGFDMYGVRVPLIVISPWAKKGFVGHKVYDHTSITRFIEARFQLPALTNRDANAEVPWELFDFDQKPARGNLTVPTVPVDRAKVDACLKLFAEPPK